MKTRVFNLPSELEEEILSRVPLKSVRLTCRKWNDLCKSERFRKLNIRKLSAATKEGQSVMVVMIDNNLHLMSLFLDKDDPSTERRGKLGLLDEQDSISTEHIGKPSLLDGQVRISEIFHCEGLLLCILEHDPRFLAWNPYLGQTRWINPKISHDSFTYALGYVDNKVKGKSCRSLKLLYYYWQRGKGVYGYDMYDFDSDLWTTLHVTPHYWRKAPQLRHGVALKGNTYWCVIDSDSGKEVLADRIICFDFTSQRFGPLLPLPFSALVPDDNDVCVTLSCVREEKLAVLLQHGDDDLYELDIWITTKIDPEEVLWSKFLRMDMRPTFIIDGSFLIDEEKKVAMGVDRFTSKFFIIGEAGYLRNLDLLEKRAYRDCMPSVYSYVPNTMQIKRKEAT